MKVDESSEVKELCFKKQFLKQKLMKIDVSSVKCPSKIPSHLEGEYLSVRCSQSILCQLSCLIKQTPSRQNYKGTKVERTLRTGSDFGASSLEFCVMPVSVDRLNTVLRAAHWQLIMCFY